MSFVAGNKIAFRSARTGKDMYGEIVRVWTMSAGKELYKIQWYYDATFARKRGLSSSYARAMIEAASTLYDPNKTPAAPISPYFAIGDTIVTKAVPFKNYKVFDYQRNNLPGEDVGYDLTAQKVV